MTTQVTLELPDHLYERAQELAAQQHQDVAGVITNLLKDALADGEQAGDGSKLNTSVRREIDAYTTLHPNLVKEYMGNYVAIFQGKLVDHDADFGALMKRVKSRYPDDFVLVRRVDRVPTRTITVRYGSYAKWAGWRC
jgi:hypothetical protein